MNPARLLLAAACAASLFACGGSTFTLGDGGTESDGGGANDGGGGDAGRAPGCPTGVPANGSACSEKMGFSCEYGADPDVHCDTLATCQSGHWSVTPPTASGSACETTNPPACPADFASVKPLTECSPLGLSCLYSEARCTCDPAPCLGACRVGPDGGAPPPVWICDLPADGSGCPIPRPRIGDACSQPSQLCDYGACTGGVAMQCTNGAWQETFAACPASARQ